jgi:hypothetical protein
MFTDISVATVRGLLYDFLACFHHCETQWPAAAA